MMAESIQRAATVQSSQGQLVDGANRPECRVTADRRKFVIDTDCGLDDSMAIMIAASNNDTVDIMAITCVHGNTEVDNAIVNVLRTLEACNKIRIPVFKGAAHPLMGNFSRTRVNFHGEDGFGDVHFPCAPDRDLVFAETAVDAMIRLVKKYPGEIELIAMGPLTNVALAIRLDEAFATNVKSVYIMGGNTEGKGNVTVSAEANFHSDPEAAYIVFNEMRCPITVVPWELCLKNYLTWEWRERLLLAETKQADLISQIEHQVQAKSKSYPGYILCDQFVMAAAIEPKVVVRKSPSLYVSVETHGHYTRGQMIVDWDRYLEKEPNAVIVEEVDMDLMRAMLSRALGHE